MGWIHHMGASINGGSQNGSTWMVYNGTSYENGWFRWFRGTPMTLETFTIRAMVKTWDGYHSMLSSGPLVVFECPLSDWWPYHISKMTTASIPVTFLRTLGLVLDLSIHYGSWLVVSNIYFFFHNIWDNPSHRLSYVSRWLKPPTRFTMGHRCPFPTGLLWSSHRNRRLFKMVHPAAG